MGLYSTNIRIEAAPGGAIGKSYLMVVARRQAGSPGGVTDAGQYWDAFVKTEEGWRIQRRTFYRPHGTPASMPVPSPNASSPPPAAGQAPPRTTTGLTLTAEDYAEIQQLYARYTFTWDGALSNGNQWVELFTPDGSHINETADPRQFFITHEELRGFARQKKLDDNRVPESMRHFITNIMLERTPEGVTSKAYRMGVNIARDGQIRLGTSGIYFDYLVKTPQGWRYKHKNYITANADVPEAAKASR
jgi:hypothetical protein